MKKKLLGLTLATVLAISITACGGDNEKNVESQKSVEVDTTESNTESESSFETPSENDSISENSEINAFIEEVNNVIQGQVGENESIESVTLENNDLHILVDLSQADPAPLTAEDLALSRTSSITDAILDLSQYDNLWDTITVDFGYLGKIQNSKYDIQENEYGLRYFPLETFILK